MQARVEPKSARKWSAACAECARETPVDKGDASTLGKNHNTAALVAQMKAADFMPFRIHVKTMGGELLPVVVVRDELVSRVKQRIASQRPEFKVARQRLAVMLADGEHEVLLDSRSIGSYCASESVVALIMADGFGGAEFVRSIGTFGHGAGQLHFPMSVRCSPDGEFLFVPDNDNHRVQVFRASDGVHIRSIGSNSSGSATNIYPDIDRLGFRAPITALNPERICLSPDRQSLWLVGADNDGLEFLGVSDRVRVPQGSALGYLPCSRRLCLSSDGRLLLVADTFHHRIQVFNVFDGALVR